MKKINFKLEKNNEIIINKQNINSIERDNQISFIIDRIKYSYNNTKFIRETKEEIIELDLIKENCLITLKEQNLNLNLNIKCLENKKVDNIIYIKYTIETEENIHNIITIEYV